MNQREHILDAAERRMRGAGYNAVSFRDIAGDIGIKSASLHYHFPKKEDLGLALVQRYSDDFHEALTNRITDNMTAKERIGVFVDLHRDALVRQKLLCLCVVFGAEARGLPAPVNAAVAAFFTRNINWMSKAYTDAGYRTASSRAKSAVAMLEGGLVVADSVKDESVFEAAAEFVLRD
ncbi:TetR/AcrR family transcriptional regulator [Litorimonas sp. WD9-15]|uniref:TetR/AcrR family transcriptional regulator n=1 Tax=Litorimonas sp. WD9-15 TaxID=3418716 RepID=UPI003D0740CC